MVRRRENRNFRPKTKGTTRTIRRRTPPVNRRRRDVRPGRQQPSTSFGGLIARGIRTLVSWLPGQSVIKPVSDLFFNAFGVTDRIVVNADKTVQAQFYITGLSSRQTLNPTDILVESTTHGTRVIDPYDGKPHILMNYSEARVINFRITAKPSNRVSSRQGMWTMAFVPFRSMEDQRYYSGTKVSTYDDVRLMPGAVTKSTSSALCLDFRPRIHDGTAFQFTSVKRTNEDVETGCLFIAFEQSSRAKYGQFEYEEFSCTVSVYGAVELRRPPQNFEHVDASSVTPVGYEYNEKCFGISAPKSVIERYPAISGVRCIDADYRKPTTAWKYCTLSWGDKELVDGFEVLEI